MALRCEVTSFKRSAKTSPTWFAEVLLTDERDYSGVLPLALGDIMIQRGRIYRSGRRYRFGHRAYNYAVSPYVAEVIIDALAPFVERKGVSLDNRAALLETFTEANTVTPREGEYLT